MPRCGDQSTRPPAVEAERPLREPEAMWPTAAARGGGRVRTCSTAATTDSAAVAATTRQGARSPAGSAYAGSTPSSPAAMGSSPRLCGPVIPSSLNTASTCSRQTRLFITPVR